MSVAVHGTSQLTFQLIMEKERPKDTFYLSYSGLQHLGQQMVHGNVDATIMGYNVSSTLLILVLDLVMGMLDSNNGDSRYRNISR